MSQLYPWKANGEPRYMRHPSIKRSGRAQATNRILVLPRGVEARSSQARRFRDLVRAALAGIENPDQAAINIARSIALASVRLDAIQARTFTDGDVDDLRLVRLAGIVSRGQAKLAVMKAQVAPLPPAEIEAKAGLAKLRSRLAEIAAKG
jgi:hypothetical protein